MQTCTDCGLPTCSNIIILATKYEVLWPTPRLPSAEQREGRFFVTSAAQVALSAVRDKNGIKLSRKLFIVSFGKQPSLLQSNLIPFRLLYSLVSSSGSINYKCSMLPQSVIDTPCKIIFFIHYND